MRAGRLGGRSSGRGRSSRPDRHRNQTTPPHNAGTNSPAPHPPPSPPTPGGCSPERTAAGWVRSTVVVKVKPPAFAYHAPNSAAEAVGLLARLEDAKVLAGGQSLIPLLNF